MFLVHVADKKHVGQGVKALKEMTKTIKVTAMDSNKKIDALVLDFSCLGDVSRICGQTFNQIRIVSEAQAADQVHEVSDKIGACMTIALPISRFEFTREKQEFFLDSVLQHCKRKDVHVTDVSLESVTDNPADFLGGGMSRNYWTRIKIFSHIHHGEKLVYSGKRLHVNHSKSGNCHRVQRP